MPVYAYRGRSARGELVTGTLDAVDQGAVADQLLTTGVTPVDIRLTHAKSPSDETGALAKLLEPRVTLVDTMLFSRQMYTLLKAGVPILRALAGLQESATNTTLRRIISDLRVSLDAGRELSTAMRRHPDVFSEFYISVVRVGETTGQLEESFDRLFSYLEFEREVRERIKTALRYPTILIGVSDFFLTAWPFLLAGMVGAVLAFVSYTRTEQGRYKWDRLKLRIPVVGPIIFKSTLSRFARAFSLASRAGVPIVQGLTVVAAVVDNSFLARRVEQMREGVERGESLLRTAVTTGVFTPVVLQMIAVGEETGEIDDLLT